MLKKLVDKLVEECSEDINGNENNSHCDFKWLWKSMPLLHNIHNIISHRFLIVSSSSAFCILIDA